MRNILNEQKSKLQQKQQLEHELLEDIKQVFVMSINLNMYKSSITYQTTNKFMLLNSGRQEKTSSVTF